MQISLPDVKEIIKEIKEKKSKFDENTNTIDYWINDYHKSIENNLKRIENKQNKEILIDILSTLLLRAMRGERFSPIHNKLKEINDINNIKDFEINEALKGYRWGQDKGKKVIIEAVKYFKDELKWNWREYIDRAEKDYEKNRFSEDTILKIKNVGYKVRDLALSGFSTKYAAFDLHVVRVSTRLGLLNYGYAFLPMEIKIPVIKNGIKKNATIGLEMGNNVGTESNYLFFHRLFIELSNLFELKPTEIDRAFWHWGRTYCNANPKCSECEIRNLCLQGSIDKN